MSNIFGTEAPAYWAVGLPVIPLKTSDEGKRPALRNWQQWAEALPSESTRRAWLRDHEKGNIGLALGPQSGLIALDIDRDELVPEIRETLQQAGVDDLPWERKGKKGVVWVFRWREGLKSLSVPGFIDFLGQGRQVVLPPSIHPDTKKPYTQNVPLLDVLDRVPAWPEGFESVLRRKYSAGGGGSGSVDIDNLPERVAKGGRDNTATAVAGAFARAVHRGQLSMYEAEHKLETWFGQAVDSPVDDPIDGKKYLSQLWGFFRKDCEGCEGRAPAYGWNDTLDKSKLIDRGLADIKDADALPYIARRYILDCRSGAYIDSEKGAVLDPITVMREHAPFLEIPGKRYDLCRVGIEQQQEMRRVDRIVFRPELPPGLTKEPELHAPVWNSWRGRQWEVSGEGASLDVQPFLDLVRAMFPNEAEAGVLLDWMAHVVQKPGVKIHWAPLLISAKGGTGKSTLVKALADQFYTEHTEEVRTKDVTGRFNDWLAGKVLVHVEEVHSPEKRAFTEALKPLITSGEVLGEAKGQPAGKIKNKANFILTSNHENCMVIGEGERRFYMLVIDDDAPVMRWTEEQWARTHRWLKTGGLALALMFMKRDLSAFNPKGEAPPTAAFKRVVGGGTTRAERALHSLWNEEAWPFSKDVVALSEVVDTARRRFGVDLSPNTVQQFIARRGARLVRGKMRVEVLPDEDRGWPLSPRNTGLWAIRNCDRWEKAGDDAVRAELIRRSGVNHTD